MNDLRKHALISYYPSYIWKQNGDEITILYFSSGKWILGKI